MGRWMPAKKVGDLPPNENGSPDTAPGSRKALPLLDAGGGTRTPDTRIMIPLL